MKSFVFLLLTALTQAITGQIANNDTNSTTVIIAPLLSSDGANFCPFPCTNLTLAYQMAGNIVWFRVENVFVRANATGNETFVEANVTTICQNVKNGFLSSILTLSADELQLLGPVGLIVPNNDYIAFVKEGRSGDYRLITPPLPAETNHWRNLANCPGYVAFPRNRNPLVVTKEELGRQNNADYFRRCGNSARQPYSSECPNVTEIVCPGLLVKWEKRLPTILWGNFINVSNYPIPPEERAIMFDSGYSVIPKIRADFRPICHLGVEKFPKSLKIELSQALCYEFPSFQLPISLKAEPNRHYVILIDEQDAKKKKRSESIVLRNLPIQVDNETMESIVSCCHDNFPSSAFDSDECHFGEHVFEEANNNKSVKCDCVEFLSKLLREEPLKRRPEGDLVTSEIRVNSGENGGQFDDSRLATLIIVTSVLFLTGLMVVLFALGYRKARNNNLRPPLVTRRLEAVMEAKRRKNASNDNSNSKNSAEIVQLEATGDEYGPISETALR